MSSFPQGGVALPAGLHAHHPAAMLELDDDVAVGPVVHHTEITAAESAEQLLDLSVSVLPRTGTGVGQRLHGVAPWGLAGREWTQRRKAATPSTLVMHHTRPPASSMSTEVMRW